MNLIEDYNLENLINNPKIKQYRLCELFLIRTANPDF